MRLVAALLVGLLAPGPVLGMTAAQRFLSVQAPAGTQPAAYWRIYITANGGQPYTGLAEVEFHATVGGAQIATGGTPSVSSSYDGSYPASKLFDNASGTEWATTAIGATPSWIAYAFASSVRPVEFRMMAGASHAGRAPTAFSIQSSSDGSTWKTIQSYTDSTWSAQEWHTFAIP